MDSASKVTCPVCERDLDCDETVVAREKGAESINRASIPRSVKVRIEAGTRVHKTCRINHINKKDIASASSKDNSARPVKGVLGFLSDHMTVKHTAFCGTDTTKIDPKRKCEDRICYVKTDAFVLTILVHCKTRADEWATVVQGRIE